MCTQPMFEFNFSSFSSGVLAQGGRSDTDTDPPVVHVFAPTGQICGSKPCALEKFFFCSQARLCDKFGTSFHLKVGFLTMTMTFARGEKWWSSCARISSGSVLLMFSGY